MIILWDELSAPALEGIIEEFVLREGTEYGASEYSLDQKKIRMLKGNSRELKFKLPSILIPRPAQLYPLFETCC